jgi:hypothetical protein
MKPAVIWPVPHGYAEGRLALHLDCTDFDPDAADRAIDALVPGVRGVWLHSCDWSAEDLRAWSHAVAQDQENPRLGTTVCMGVGVDPATSIPPTGVELVIDVSALLRDLDEEALLDALAPWGSVVFEARDVIAHVDHRNITSGRLDVLAQFIAPEGWTIVYTPRRGRFAPLVLRAAAQARGGWAVRWREG